jgi:NADH dehydrogenase
LNIAIVVGGPEEIELAGALAEMKRHVIPKDFLYLNISNMKINLYEASPKLL